MSDLILRCAAYILFPVGILFLILRFLKFLTDCEEQQPRAGDDEMQGKPGEKK